MLGMLILEIWIYRLAQQTFTESLPCAGYSDRQKKRDKTMLSAIKELIVGEKWANKSTILSHDNLFRNKIKPTLLR